jgi:hypothetical protein
MGRSTVAITVALIVALAGVGVGTAALVRKPATASSEVAILRTQLNTAQAELSGATQSASKQEAKLSKLLSCIPELLGEITGLTPETTGSTIYLSQTRQISSYCSAILEAH